MAAKDSGPIQLLYFGRSAVYQLQPPAHFAIGYFGDALGDYWCGFLIFACAMGGALPLRVCYFASAFPPRYFIMLKLPLRSSSLRAESFEEFLFLLFHSRDAPRWILSAAHTGRREVAAIFGLSPLYVIIIVCRNSAAGIRVMPVAYARRSRRCNAGARLKVCRWIQKRKYLVGFSAMAGRCVLRFSFWHFLPEIWHRRRRLPFVVVNWGFDSLILLTNMREILFISLNEQDIIILNYFL